MFRGNTISIRINHGWILRGYPRVSQPMSMTIVILTALYHYFQVRNDECVQHDTPSTMSQNRIITIKFETHCNGENTYTLIVILFYSIMLIHLNCNLVQCHCYQTFQSVSNDGNFILIWPSKRKKERENKKKDRHNQHY